MKKILIIISAVLLIGCNPDPTPQPIQPTPTTSTSVLTTSTYDFTGNWDCYDWVVDEITGMTRQRRFIFSSGVFIVNSLSLNSYNADSTFLNQIFTMHAVNIDSNYFNHSYPSQRYEGELLTDTTLMVHQYIENSFGLHDTVQSKLFIKE